MSSKLYYNSLRVYSIELYTHLPPIEMAAA